VVDSGVGNVRFQTEKAQQGPCNACCCVFCSSCDDIAGGGVVALWRHLSSFTPRMGCIGNFTKFRALPRKISSFFIASCLAGAGAQLPTPPAILASSSLVQHSNFQPMYSNSSRHGHEVDRHTMAVFINCDHHQTRGTKCECSAHASILHSWAMIQYDETTCTGTKQNGLQPTSHDPHTNCHAQPHACSPATNDSTKAYKCH
jgi:hypothetical protein